MKVAKNGDKAPFVVTCLYILYYPTSIFTVNEFPFLWHSVFTYIFTVNELINLKMLMVNDRIAYFLQCLNISINNRIIHN